MAFVSRPMPHAWYMVKVWIDTSKGVHSQIIVSIHIKWLSRQKNKRALVESDQSGAHVRIVNENTYQSTSNCSIIKRRLAI